MTSPPRLVRRYANGVQMVLLPSVARLWTTGSASMIPMRSVLLPCVHASLTEPSETVLMNKSLSPPRMGAAQGIVS